MRDAADAALSPGVNLAFLGANAVYRKIRLEPQYGEPGRLEVNYKDDTDPAGIINPADGTSNWGSPPVNEPESLLTGSTYISVGANDAWSSPTLPAGGGPAPVSPRARPAPRRSRASTTASSRAAPGRRTSSSSATPRSRRRTTTRTSPTSPGPAAEGSSPLGMASFVSLLSLPDGPAAGRPAVAVPGVTPILQRAMVNLYGLFGAGPASRTMPSQPNWQQYYRSP